MLLTDIVKQNAKRYPNKTAVVMRIGYRTLALTYQEVDALATKIACLLEKNDVRAGDTVLLLAPNSPYWICVFWGALLNGSVIVPLNMQSTGAMVKKIADQTEAKIIFTHLHFKEDLPAALKRYDIELIREEVAGLDCTGFQKATAKESDVAQIMYTSGTTGEPKGVMLTHHNISSNLEALSEAVPIPFSDTFLSILPLSHIFEQVAGFLTPFRSGATIVYAHSPAAIKDLLKEHRATKMAAVPEFLRVVMAKIEAAAEAKGKQKLFGTLLHLSSRLTMQRLQRLLFHSVHKSFGGRLATVACGGAPLDPALEKKWNALGIVLLQGYGLTETSPVVSTNTYGARRLGSVGKIVSGVQVQIAPDGEILVKGPNVFQGYFKNKEKTKEAFTNDGWFRTDDIGELDKDGFLYLKGRKKYIIKGPGAQNVYPEDIECALNKIAGVKDSCVVGLLKESGAVEIHAVLLRSPEAPEAERIVEQANSTLASYQRIARWSVWPEEDFPRSATRKVKKEVVLTWLKEKRPVPKEAAGEKTPLMHLVAEITGAPLSRINSTTTLVSELNLDSLLRIELVTRIEEKFGVIVEEATIDATTTVANVEEMMKTAKPAEKRRLFKRSLVSLPAILGRSVFQTFFFPLARIFVKLKVEGRESLRNLPLPAIFMLNHISYLDSLVILMALPRRGRRRVAFAAAEDVLYEYFARIAWIVEPLFHTFPFPRREHEDIKSGLEYMGQVLDAGCSVIVYPEGQMSESGRLLPLKRGAGLMAREMDASIVPVKMTGTNQVLPYGKIWPRTLRCPVTVRFGKPLTFSRHDSYIEATEEIQKALTDL